MSRGPGHVERTVEATFRQYPFRAFRPAELAQLAYDLPADRLTRAHLVAVRRAANKIARRLGWQKTTRTYKKPGGLRDYIRDVARKRRPEAPPLPFDPPPPYEPEPDPRHNETQFRSDRAYYDRDAFRKLTVGGKARQRWRKLDEQDDCWRWLLDALAYTFPNADIALAFDALADDEQIVLHALAGSGWRKGIAEQFKCSERHAGRLLDETLMHLAAVLAEQSAVEASGATGR